MVSLFSVYMPSISVCYQLSRFLIELFLQRDTNTLPTLVASTYTVGVSPQPC